MMRNTKLKKKRQVHILKKINIMFLLIWTFLFFTGSLYADSLGNLENLQVSSEIKGKIVDNTGQPIPGVTVLIKGTSQATMTSVEGLFTLQTDKLPVVLRVSCLSYETKEINVSNSNFLDIRMEDNDELLDEVVVIGYQAVTKRETHGAVSSINMKQLEGITAPSVDVMLQGVIPGMNVQTVSGAPGAATQIAIRGNTSLDGVNTSNPLIVLDGIPVDPSVVGFNTTSSNFFSNINPNDIEAIHVLKDASGASIYGSRAANGVIQITTKRGQTGKPRISLNTNTQVNMKPALPKVYGGVKERQKLLEILTTAANGNFNLDYYMPLILTDSINPAFNNSTNWFDQFYGESITQDYNLAISGGDENSNYRLSAGYYDQEGTIKGTGYDRFSFNGNMGNTIGRLRLNTSISYTNSKTKSIYDEDTKTSANTTTKALNMTLENMPSSLLYLNETDKQVMLGQYEDTRNDNSDDNFRFAEYMTFNITDYLYLNAQYNYTVANSRFDYFSPSSASYEQNAFAISDTKRSTTQDFSVFLNFDKRFNEKHKLMGVVGLETQKTKKEGTYAAGYYLTTDDIKIVSGASQENVVAKSTFTENAMVGYFARAQYYLFGERYSLSASIRRDGSSRFHSDTRWGYFPAFGAFWMISDEPFMKWSNNFLTMLKLRGSYGETGRQPESNDYGYLSRYESPGTYDGNTVTTPRYEDGIAQRDFTWEKNKEWNVGLDIDLFNSKYFFQVDVYSRETDGLYYTLTLPYTSGYDYYKTNAVGVRNSGVEFMARAMNVFPNSWKDWQLMVSGNISYNQNKVTKLPHNDRSIVNGFHYLSVGSPINQFYLSKYNGVYLNEEDIPANPFTGEYYKSENGTIYQVGDAHWEDIDGNYKWVSTVADRTIVGDPNPDWTGGINASLRYKNWTLETFCSFTLNRDIWNQNTARLLSKFESQNGINEYGAAYSNSANQYQMMKDFIARRMLIDLSDFNFWTPNGDNSNAEYPFLNPYGGVSNYWYTTSLYLEDGSYFKVNTVTLSYNFGKITGVPVNNLKLSLTANNVAVIKDCRAADPQLVNADGIYTGNGYGLSRSFSFRLIADF